MSQIELTVLVITYNHAAFIERALGSVLSQETDFDYEIIVSEDCSTDGTREIVQHLAAADPDRIRLLLSERNLNDNTVVRRGLEEARGSYVALLDGDDFWISRDKLQRQVDFLETHPECSSCFHNMIVIYEDGETPSHLLHQSDRVDGLATRKPKPRSTLADIVRSNFLPTGAVVLRSHVARALPQWFDEVAAGDWVLHLVSAEHGDIAYLDEVMGAYRVHPGGVWTMNQSRFLNLSDVEEIARTYDLFNQYLAFSFDREIRDTAALFYERSAVRFYKRGRRRDARVCALRALRRAPRATLPWRWRSVAVLALTSWPD